MEKRGDYVDLICNYSWKFDINTFQTTKRPSEGNASLGAISLMYSNLFRRCLARGPFEFGTEHLIGSRLIKAVRQFIEKVVAKKFIFILL